MAVIQARLWPVLNLARTVALGSQHSLWGHTRLPGLPAICVPSSLRHGIGTYEVPPVRWAWGWKQACQLSGIAPLNPCQGDPGQVIRLPVPQFPYVSNGV